MFKLFFKFLGKFFLTFHFILYNEATNTHNTFTRRKEIKDMESRERMEQMMEDQYNRGITVGMELMMEKLRMAADNGTPIEIDGRAWYLKSDIENLRDIFEDMENGGL
jgi:hypothetical protein